jgi:hypothetical protein
MIPHDGSAGLVSVLCMQSLPRHVLLDVYDMLACGDEPHEVQRRIDCRHAPTSSIALGVSYLLSALAAGGDLVPVQCRRETLSAPPPGGVP